MGTREAKQLSYEAGEDPCIMETAYPSEAPEFKPPTTKPPPPFFVVFVFLKF